MNAKELADLYATTDMPSDWDCQAQAMLRKLQADNEKLTADCVSLHAEIEDLKLQNKYLKGSKPSIQVIAENEALKAIVKDAIRLAESDANGGGVDWYFCSKEWEDKLKTQADIEYESDKAYWKAQEK